jgi:hypothetical protein
MPGKWCNVSYTDLFGIGHAVTIKAESLYEAAAEAVAIFKADKLIDEDPNLGTELKVHLCPEAQTGHTLPLRQLLKWAEHTPDAPVIMTRRHKVRSILG